MAPAGAEAAPLVALDRRGRDLGVVGVEEPAAALVQIGEQGALLVDEALREAIVAHGDRQVDPGGAGDQVGAEDHGPPLGVDLGREQAGRVTVADVEGVARAQRGAGGVGVHQLQAAAGLEELLEPGKERRSVPRVRGACPLEGVAADDEARLREQQLGLGAGLPGREQPTRVVEVQVGQDHDVDVLVAEADAGEGVEQHVPLLEHPEALAQARLEEGADAGLEEHAPGPVLHEERAAGERDAVLLVGGDPAGPERPRGVAEHRAAVEALAVAFERGQGAQGGLLGARGCTSARSAWLVERRGFCSMNRDSSEPGWHHPRAR